MNGERDVNGEQRFSDGEWRWQPDATPPTPAAPAVPAAVPDEGDDAAAAPAPPAAPTRPRRGLAIALALSLIAIVALAIPLAMLATARFTWESQNAELRSQVELLTDEVSTRNARIAELEVAEAQLETLKAEYSAAVNQGARGSELVEELEDIVDAYQTCVEAQNEHFTVLRNRDRYVASSVDESERSIVDFCADVAVAYADFRAAHD